MSEEHNYCTTKGLGWAFLILAFMIVGLPVIMLMLMVGLEDYAMYCNMNILPCFGLKE
jgi:hypothetical protein|tara:strand:+ start:293 stop:466 length:174 start_codon:yes stop_codon:yes gene_type:complete